MKSVKDMNFERNVGDNSASIESCQRLRLESRHGERERERKQLMNRVVMSHIRDLGGNVQSGNNGSASQYEPNGGLD